MKQKQPLLQRKPWVFLLAHKEKGHFELFFGNLAKRMMFFDNSTKIHLNSFRDIFGLVTTHVPHLNNKTQNTTFFGPWEIWHKPQPTELQPFSHRPGLWTP